MKKKSWNDVKNKYLEFHRIDKFTENMSIDIDFGYWLINEAFSERQITTEVNKNDDTKQLNIADVRILLAAFVNWYNNDKDCYCKLYNEDIELFIAAYKS
jgi:hypothetical protein